MPRTAPRAATCAAAMLLAATAWGSAPLEGLQATGEPPGSAARLRPGPAGRFSTVRWGGGVNGPPPGVSAAIDQEYEPAAVSPGRAALMSAVVPGAGQYALGRRRAWAYFALEAAGWVLWAERRSSAGDLVTQYRDFAWEQGRIQSGPRVDGDFDYYETLTKWTRSGAWDTDPATGGVQPETDPTTFNGMIWERAVAIYLPGGPTTPPGDPGWQRALDYYAERGYGTELLWDWTGTGSDQETYAGILDQSDDRYRQATNVLGAILANHLVSSVDAFLTARGIATPSEVRLVPQRLGDSTRWHAVARVPFGR